MSRASKQLGKKELAKQLMPKQIWTFSRRPHQTSSPQTQVFVIKCAVAHVQEGKCTRGESRNNNDNNMRCVKKYEHFDMIYNENVTPAPH